MTCNLDQIIIIIITLELIIPNASNVSDTRTDNLNSCSGLDGANVETKSRRESRGNPNFHLQPRTFHTASHFYTFTIHTDFVFNASNP